LAAKAGDGEAARHFNISARSVKRYRSRMLGDSELAQAVKLKLGEFEAASAGWAEEAANFMSRAIKKLGQLVDEAKPEQMRDVTGAIKIVGELDITRKVMGAGDEQPGASAEGAAAEAAQSRDAGGKAGAGTEDPLH
jgi:hypothetical protein